MAKKRVYFRLEASKAKTVVVLGTFNDWEERPLKAQKGGVWATWTMLETGRYEYRYKVDGKWYNDPEADTVPNEHGSENCVVEVA